MPWDNANKKDCIQLLLKEASHLNREQQKVEYCKVFFIQLQIGISTIFLDVTGYYQENVW